MGSELFHTDRKVFQMNKFFLICLGGAVGTGARYLLSDAFPYGTLTVNVLGSFLMGVLMQLGLTTDLLSPTARVVLTTGLMGGFTTYSSFNYETIQYFQNGETLKGMMNLVVMVGVCLAAGFAGLVFAKRLIGN